MSDVISRPKVNTARWKVKLYYRSEDLDLIDVEHGIEEIGELQEIVERGPDWNTIERIEITLDRKSDPSLTIERAAEQ